MTESDQRACGPAAGAGANVNVGVVRAVWNPRIVERLADGVSRALDELAVSKRVEMTVPGCFEIPLATRMLSMHGDVGAIVAIGAVIRGETTHYELVSEAVAQGIMAVQLEFGTPIGFGVITAENEAQALARSQVPSGHNLGEDAVRAAVEMALRARTIPSTRDLY